MWGNMVALTCISTFDEVNEVNKNQKSICLQGQLIFQKPKRASSFRLTFTHHGSYLKIKTLAKPKACNSHEPQSYFLASIYNIHLRLHLLSLFGCVGEIMRVYYPITMQVPFFNHDKSCPLNPRYPVCQDNNVRDNCFKPL